MSGSKLHLDQRFGSHQQSSGKIMAAFNHSLQIFSRVEVESFDKAILEASRSFIHNDIWCVFGIDVLEDPAVSKFQLSSFWVEVKKNFMCNTGEKPGLWQRTWP